MRILLDDVKNNQQQFADLHLAQDYYGGSDVANIAGVGYESPLSVWLRKTGKVKGAEVTHQMQYGKHMEPFLADLLAERLSTDVQLLNQVWQHESKDWMIVTPDAQIVYADPTGSGLNESELVEFKAHKIYASKFWSEDTASDSAMCQLQWALAVSGRRAGYCCALIGGDCDKFYSPRFEASADVQAQLIERVERFRDFVQKDIPPAAGADDAKLIKEHLVKSISKGEAIDLTEQYADLMLEYGELMLKFESAKSVYQGLEERKKAIINTILKDCKGAETVKIGGNIIKVTMVERTAYTAPASSYLKTSVKMGE